MSCMQVCFETDTDTFSKSVATGAIRLKNYMIGISRRQLSGLNFERLSQREFLQDS